MWSRHLPEWPEHWKHLLPLRTPRAYVSGARVAPLCVDFDSRPTEAFLLMHVHEAERCPAAWRSASLALSRSSPDTTVADFAHALSEGGEGTMLTDGFADAEPFRNGETIGFEGDWDGKWDARHGEEVSVWLLAAARGPESSIADTRLRDVTLLHDAGRTSATSLIDASPLCLACCVEDGRCDETDEDVLDDRVRYVNDFPLSPRLRLKYELCAPNFKGTYRIRPYRWYLE